MVKRKAAQLVQQATGRGVKAVQKVARRGQTARPRGKPFEKGHTLGFKKGQNTIRRKGDANPKPYVKMKDKLVEELMKPASAYMRARAGLRGKQATKYDCIIASLADHAQADANVAFKCRDVVEGLLVQKNVTVNAEIAELLQNPEFMQFLMEQRNNFFTLIGAANGAADERPDITINVPALPSHQEE